MPTFFKAELDDEQKKLQEQQGQQGFTLSGQTSTMGADEGGQGNKPGPQPTSSGRFTPLQKYIEANRGGAVKQQLVDPLEQQAKQAREQLTGAQGQFNQAVDQSRVKQDKAAVDDAVLNPSQTLADQTKLKTVQAQRDANYGGPSDLKGVEYGNTALQAAKTADEQVEATKTEKGRIGLLDSKFRRPTSTRGEVLLDQLLLQNDPDARQGMLDLQAGYDTLDKEADTAFTGSRDYATAAKNETDAARNYFNEKFTNQGTGAIPTRAAEYDTRARNAMTKRDEDWQAALQASQSLEYTPEQLARFGLSAGSKVYGDLNPSNYLNYNFAFNPTAGNMASVQERAAMDALAQIAGIQNPLGDTSNLPVIDPNSGMSFDTEGFNRDNAALKQRMDEELAKLTVQDDPNQWIFNQRMRDPDGQLTYDEWKAQRDGTLAAYNGPTSDLGQYLSQSSRDMATRFYNDYFNRIGQPFNDIISAIDKNRVIRSKG